MKTFAKDTAMLQGSTTRRHFLGGLVGTSAVGVAAVAGGSPILEALARLEQALAQQSRLVNRPSRIDPADAMDRAAHAELLARRDLVLLVAAAAQVKLDSLDSSVEPHQDWVAEAEPFAVASYIEGDRLFVLVLVGNDGSGAEIRSASGREIWIRPVVVDIANSPARVRRRGRTGSRSLATTNLVATS